MSELSYLEKLLNGAEVEWKSLGDVVDLQRGRRLVKSQLETSGKYAVYQNSMTPLGYYHECNVAAKSSFIICAGAAGEIGYSEDEFWAADDVHFAITPENINGRFLFHFLLTQKNKISGQVRRASIPRLSKSVLEKLEFPIPCPDNPEKSLAIQSEIVRILDKFTALSAELTTELTARKKQYNYYRDQLLSFDDSEIEWKTLGDEDLFHIGSGGTPSKSKPEYWDNGTIPWLKSESCNNEPVYLANNFISELGLKKSSAKLLPKKTTLIALVGATIFKTAFLEFEASTNQNIASIKSKRQDLINDKFIFYFLTNLYDKLKSEMRNYGMLNLTTLRQFRVPVLSMDEQKRIISTMDKFDTLTNSITEGLPREIELRQKQYEYYRDMLFSFPKPEVTEV
ncbi:MULTISPECIES: restriction endonuclease subunit S [Yersinia]|jgi:type I restriction enzyme S subunit|uniref:restriction endonuclease subunit S n=1 Tax=Yersinia TaxID=629 RepID=UPI0009B71913|nr:MULTISPECIES: restriction endonuclease subunit S [Yersinia]ARB82699.1 restriction endonuclease subunit S [Yersinia sp. FDAARGOS_228]AVL36431.1 restriction endonuclease subunit S [Yersinia intermedia]